MGTVIRKIMPSGMYRTGMLEAWFHDMSMDGLHVRDFGYYYSAFEKGEPKDYRYSMDIMAKDPGKDELQVFSDCGWEHVGYRRDVHLFRTSGSSGARPLHTDMFDRSISIKRLQRKMNTGIILALTLIVSGIAALVFFIMTDMDFYLRMLDRGTMNRINLALLAISSFRAFEEYVGISELSRYLRREGKQDMLWRKALTKRIASVAVLTAGVAWCVFADIGEIIVSDQRIMPLYEPSSDILRLPDIETRNDLVSEELPYYHEPGSLLTDRMYTGSEVWKSSDGYEPHLFVNFYDLKIPDHSRLVTEGWESRLSKGSLMISEDVWLDYLSTEERWNGCLVFASKGDLVLVASYTGEESVISVVDSIREYLISIDEGRN
ncbi:DUF2812 domain-containing protein [Youngiibacter fragilis]|uniref:DUF2812 domain-containing protein n=1 Tax=Youngiibacter fragilis 232.1 TaxID=994573 RepID=V7I385_9CLOT|nr:DUF2812 domain-containing protein [Youngiibacter fragilis]ETA79634.1 hypothetical protein T472_0215875 [Youngiibacter fragilis 232.1]